MSDNEKTKRILYLYTTILREGSLVRSKLIEYYTQNFNFDSSTDEKLRSNVERRIQNDIKELKQVENIKLITIKKNNTTIYSITKDNQTKTNTLQDLRNKLFSNAKEENNNFLYYFIEKITENQREIISSEMPTDIILAKQKDLESYVYIHQFPISNLTYNSEQTKKLVEATGEMRKISFLYQNRHESGKRKRKVIPYILYYYLGKWYLIAKDLEDDKSLVKTYMLSKMEDISILEPKIISDTKGIEEKRLKNLEKMRKERDKIMSRLKENRNIFTEYLSGKHKVEIRFVEEAATYFKQNNIGMKQEIIREYDDGSVSVRFWVTSSVELWQAIVSWLGLFHFENTNTIIEDFIERVQTSSKYLLEKQ